MVTFHALASGRFGCGRAPHKRTAWLLVVGEGLWVHELFRRLSKPESHGESLPVGAVRRHPCPPLSCPHPLSPRTHTYAHLHLHPPRPSSPLPHAPCPAAHLHLWPIRIPRPQHLVCLVNRHPPVLGQTVRRFAVGDGEIERLCAATLRAENVFEKRRGGLACMGVAGGSYG